MSGPRPDGSVATNSELSGLHADSLRTAKLYKQQTACMDALNKCWGKG